MYILQRKAIDKCNLKYAITIICLLFFYLNCPFKKWFIILVYLFIKYIYLYIFLFELLNWRNKTVTPILHNYCLFS